MHYKIHPHQERPHAEVRLPLRKWLLSGLWLGGCLAAQADEMPARLETAARQALARHVEQQGWNPTRTDFRVWLPPAAEHLPPCRQPLRLERAHQSTPPWGRQPYLVFCDDEPGWRLSARVDVSLWLPVLTARHELAKQHRLAWADLLSQPMDVSRLYRGFSTRPEELLGLRTPRRIRAGQLLTADALLPDLLVHKDEEVQIRASGNGIQASMTGVALEDGSQGEAIRVRNVASGREIQGWVSAPGVVDTRF